MLSDDASISHIAPKLQSAIVYDEVHISIKEHRRRWLRLLVEIYGSQVAVANRVEGLAPAYISQILNGVRDMGDQLARRVERSFKMEPHTLDNPSTWHKYVEALEDQERPAEGSENEVRVPMYIVERNDGGTRYSSKPIGVLCFVREWIDELGLDAAHLVALQVGDDAMAPEYKPGDALIVDRRSVTPVSGRVYVFRSNGDLQIRRLVRNLSGSITMRTDNSLGRGSLHEETVTPAQFKKLDVLGEVVWRGG